MTQNEFSLYILKNKVNCFKITLLEVEKIFSTGAIKSSDSVFIIHITRRV